MTGDVYVISTKDRWHQANRASVRSTTFPGTTRKMDASHIVMKMCVNNDINERNSNEKGYVSSGGGGGGDGGRR